jgi:type I restriction enzyme S subunit
MNETLEAMAQATFRDWFVDFGPTRRKMEGATDPDKIMGGITQDKDAAARLAALFPVALADNGLPEGWVVSTVGDQFDLKIGRTPPRKESQHFTDGNAGVPWISIRDLGECGVFVSETSEGLTEQSASTFRVPVIKSGTVIVSFKLTVGRVAITARNMHSNEAVAQLGNKPNGPSPYFAYCWMKHFDYSQLASTSSIATAVNSKSIAAMPFPLVGYALMAAFHNLIKPVFEMIGVGAGENQTLAATRDLLLPRLMSGEIRLKDAEKQAEAAE